MKNVVFTDIDGVLNSLQSLKKNNANRLFYGRISNLNSDYLIKWYLSYLDFEKVQEFKRLIQRTDSEVVVLSAWKTLREWPIIEERLVQMGIPVAGVIDDTYGRGRGILDYISEHKVGNYIVLDDGIFEDYEETLEIMNHLFKCDYYNEGLTPEIAAEAEIFLRQNQEKSLRFFKLKL